MRSNAEIEKKIENIKKEREELPQFSAFGDDNYAAIDGQLEILNTALEKGEGAILALEDGIEDEIPESDSELSIWEAKRNIVIWLLKRG